MSIDAAYHLLFWITLIVLALLAVAALIRTITGRLTVDKIIGINFISTLVVTAIAVLTVLLAEDYIADIAVVYVMISFIAVMLLVKIYINLFELHSGSAREDIKKPKERKKKKEGVSHDR